MASPDDRPLTARSVLASAILGLDPPEANVADLIRLAALFDISENRTRVALSRMVAAGEASTDGQGRYRLEGDLLSRQARQQVSRTGATRRWQGRWSIVVTTTTFTDSAARNRRRRALLAARLAELREGVWVRPDNLDVRLPDWLATDGYRVHGTVDGDPAALARELWDLTGWSRTAADLLDRLEATEPDPSRLAPGFVLSASVLRHLQSDPLLPGELLPERWPGRDLRAVYEGWDRRYRDQLAAWYHSAR